MIESLNLNALSQYASGETRGDNLSVSAVSVDSRSIQTGGALYVALVGKRLDGHAFVEEALAKGASAAMVNQSWAQAHPDVAPLIIVDDTSQALLRLSKAWTALWQSNQARTLMVLSGSNGKTSTKEMIACILRQHFGDEAVLVTTGNLNNTIGLPLTLLRLRAHHCVAVVEAGINVIGEMAVLAENLHPNIVLITNAQRAHLEGFVDVAQIAREKGVLYEHLAPHGIALINRDDASHPIWEKQANGHQKKYFSATQSEITSKNNVQHIKMRYGEQAHTFLLPALGVHQARNAIAALSVSEVLNIPFTVAKMALKTFKGVKGRMYVHRLDNMHIIDDSYNANPDSMRAAIETLCACPAPRILIMGDMYELGSNHIELHREIQEYALSHPIAHVFVSGSQHRTACQRTPVLDSIHCGTSYESMATHIKNIVASITTVPTILVKGSRLAGLEKLVYLLAPCVLQKE